MHGQHQAFDAKVEAEKARLNAQVRTCVRASMRVLAYVCMHAWCVLACMCLHTCACKRVLQCVHMSMCKRVLSGMCMLFEREKYALVFPSLRRLPGTGMHEISRERGQQDEEQPADSSCIYLRYALSITQYPGFLFLGKKEANIINNQLAYEQGRDMEPLHSPVLCPDALLPCA